MDAAKKNGTRLIGWNFTEWLAFSLAVFIVLFPKGGFRAGSLPLTWGYGLLCFALGIGVPYWLVYRSTRVRRGVFFAFLCAAPLQILFFYSFLVNGIEFPAFAFSDFVGFFVLPFAFLAIFPLFLKNVRMDSLLRLVCQLVFLAAAYGIFLFAWRTLTGKYIEIPFLTVNSDDLGSLDNKFNARPDGIFFKLISTYNNGNQYGVATLMLLPLFDHLEKRRFQRLTVKVALMLTLSRTVWIGLVLYEVLALLQDVVRDLSSLPRLSLRYKTLFRLSRVGGILFAVLGMTFIFSGVSFLLDASLGGRTDLLSATLGHVTLFPTQPVSIFREIIYASAATMLGWTGVAAITLLFCSPLVLALAFQELRDTPIKIAACHGLVLYIFLAAMDGAVNYIPTMAFYWFLWMLMAADYKLREVHLNSIPAVRNNKRHLLFVP